MSNHYKQIISKFCVLLAVLYAIVSFSACGKKDASIVNDDAGTVSIIDPLEVMDTTESINPDDEIEIIDFASKISSSFIKEDINEFKKLISSNEINWIVLQGGEAYIEVALTVSPLSWNLGNSR